MLRVGVTGLGWIFVVIMTAGAAVADPVRIPYRAVLAGVEAGSGTLEVNVGTVQYDAAIDGHLFPLQERPPQVRTTARASGMIGRRALQTQAYSAVLVQNGQSRRIGFSIVSDVASGIKIVPPLPPATDREPLTERHRRDVIDPVTAFVIPAAMPGMAPLSACGRTQNVFDGSSRYDLVLFPSRVETVVIAGQPIVTVVCRAGVRLIAGHRKHADRGPIRRALIWFAPVGDGRVLVPVRIEANLRQGRLVIEATDLSAFPAQPT